jgi:polyisoprenyl-phosphate glycosyltransferase
VERNAGGERIFAQRMKLAEMKKNGGLLQAPDLAWVVATYRTGQFAEELTRRCLAASESHSLSSVMVFVDDACPERSFHKIQALVDRYPVIALRLSGNVGQDAALREGLRHSPASHAVLIDGDLQDPPEAIAALWPKLEAGNDAVFADRRGAYESGIRLLTSWMYRRIFSMVTGLPRGAGLFVLLRENLVRFVAATDHYPIYMLAVLAAFRGKFTSVTIDRSRRTCGVSSYSSLRRLHKGFASLAQAIAVKRNGRSTRERKPSPCKNANDVHV